MRYHKRPRIRFETPAIEPESSIRVLQSQHARFGFDLHYHTEVELTLIRRGYGLRFVGNSIDEFHQGDLCLLGGGLLHTWQSHPASRRNSAIVVQFDRAVLKPVETAWPEGRLLGSLLDRSACGLRLVDRAGKIAAALEALAATHPGSLEQMSWFLKVLAYAAGAEQQVALAAPTGTPEHASAAARRLNRVLQHLHARLAEPLRLSEVAAIAGLSPVSFSRFFSRMVGKSFTRYVNEWRIRIACQKLIETQASITDVAFSSGFENLSNFNRRFRQFKHTTPRAYRVAQLSI